ncbi:hypothetical protein FOA52_005257 [Chlamydomonas sp. UWO 241]|nr:hypothetical protein FOA52_005257 [Chlamydomonas sp. UWO 241]
MNLSIMTWDDQFVNIRVDPSTVVADVKAILQAETAVPSSQQALVYGGKILKDSDPLSAYGVTDNDVIQMVPAEETAAQQSEAAGGGGSNGTQAVYPMEMHPDGSAKNAVALMQHIKSSPHQLAALAENNPPLARAIEQDDVATFQDTLRKMTSSTRERNAEMEKWMRRAEEEPYNIEVQRKIEEIIQQKNIQESYADALEHNPEMVVGQVHMLYVNMEVNGVKTKAFVDSGAQMTIMTQEFAERCYLTRLIDKRFSGTAHGVGVSKIIGRIHQAPAVVGGHHIATSITVLEQKSGPAFILGLDNLKRHQCCIDLGKNQLTFGSCDAALTFLSDAEIPSDFTEAVEELSEAEAKAKRESATGAPPPHPHPTGPTSAAAAESRAAAIAASRAADAAESRAAAAAAPAGSASNTDAKLAKLMGLGFSRQQCEAALAMTGGNEEYAASALFEGDHMMG